MSAQTFRVIDPHGCPRSSYAWLSEAQRYLHDHVRACERALWHIEWVQ